jgi:tetratricopeptide (TPR) repeat protein
VIYLFNILLSFPKSILRKIKSIKADRNLSKLSEALSCLLVGNKKLAISSYNKISGSSLSELKDLYNIVSSEIATDPEERISILLNLADKKPFSYFAYKRLSQIFRELERYDQEGECLEQIGESVSLESRSS